MGENEMVGTLRAAGFPTESRAIRTLRTYHRLLLDWNRRQNMISRQIREHIYEELFYDSLVPVLKHLLPEGARCVDLGTGAGIPGIILAIFRPDLNLHLVESIRKKVLFLKKIIRELGLERVTVCHGRVEVLARDPALAESFYTVTCKAFGSVAHCLKAGIPLLKPAGIVIIYKGPDVEKELGRARSDFPFYFLKTVEYILPESKKRRQLVLATAK